MAKINTGLRVDAEVIGELEALALLMTSRAGGAEVTPHEAARAALRRGIAVLRAELTDETAKQKEAPRKAMK